MENITLRLIAATFTVIFIPINAFGMIMSKEKASRFLANHSKQLELIAKPPLKISLHEVGSWEGVMSKLKSFDGFFTLYAPNQTEFSPACLEQLSNDQKSRLVKLNIPNRENTEQIAKWLSENRELFPNLTCLQAWCWDPMGWNKTSTKAVAYISTLTSLTNLDLSGHELSPEDLAPLSKLVNLKRLDLQGNNIGYLYHEDPRSNVELMLELSKLQNLIWLKTNHPSCIDAEIFKGLLPDVHLSTADYDSRHKRDLLAEAFSFIEHKSHIIKNSTSILRELLDHKTDLERLEELCQNVAKKEKIDTPQKATDPVLIIIEYYNALIDEMKLIAKSLEDK